MPMFRKKPVDIEARQVPARADFSDTEGYVDAFLALAAWSGGTAYVMRTKGASDYPGDPGTDHILVPTPDGQMQAMPDDWIVKEVTGAFFPVKPDVFEKTYKSVDDVVLPERNPDPILSVDFDGVLHAYTSGWQGATIIDDGPNPGAMKWLRQVVKRFEVHIYSSRSTPEPARQTMRARILEWLIAEHGDADGRAVFEALHFPTEKPLAFVILDDRAVTFTGTFPPPADLRAFKTWTELAKEGS